MLLGTNKFVFNQATMKQIIQEYFERKFVNCDVEVTHIEEKSANEFTIQVNGKVSIKMLNEG
jgi:hypothetical protein